jgi:hypothetical protein
MNRSLCSVGHEGLRQRSAKRARHCALSLSFAVMLGALCAGPASAALYKWTDENGRVVYSDQPPPGNVKVDTLAGPPPPANPNAVKELAAKEADAKKQQVDAAEGAKKTAQARVDTDRRNIACKDARAEIGRLAANQIMLYTVNEKGEQVFMDDADRRKRRETLETMLRNNNCPPG